MSAGDDLAALLTATGNGDRPAFARLYQLTSPKLLGLIRRILGDPAEAEDVLQDVYVRIWAAAPTFDASRGPAMAWLATTARNRAVDRLRRAGGRRNAGSPEDLGLPDASERHPGEALGDRGALERCLGGLGAEQRTSVLLAYLDGWSREELAEKFGRPVGTIKSWLSRALVHLRACLEEGEAR